MGLRTFFLPHEDGHGLNAMHVYTMDEMAAAIAAGVDTLEGTVLIAADLADALVLAYIAKSERSYPRPRVRAVTTPGTPGFAGAERRATTTL